jgi:outer membrane protein OmpA-like peptidoglycan-associated protein
MFFQIVSMGAAAAGDVGSANKGIFSNFMDSRANVLFSRTPLYFAALAIAPVGISLYLVVRQLVIFALELPSNIRSYRAGKATKKRAEEGAFRPEPIGRTYLVFFDSGEHGLTSEAKKVVQWAAHSSVVLRLASATVTGHVDAAEAGESGIELSVGRAESVRNELVRLGMDTRRIKVRGLGFQTPMIRTAPETRNPQNRRVVIELGDSTRA